jgi:hypothetical protein
MLIEKTNINPLEPTRRQCPKCRKGLLDERVPRAALVKTFLGFLPLKRYLCRKCMRKTYVLNKER